MVRDYGEKWFSNPLCQGYDQTVDDLSGKPYASFTPIDGFFANYPGNEAIGGVKYIINRKENGGYHLTGFETRTSTKPYLSMDMVGDGTTFTFSGKQRNKNFKMKLYACSTPKSKLSCHISNDSESGYVKNNCRLRNTNINDAYLFYVDEIKSQTYSKYIPSSLPSSGYKKKTPDGGELKFTIASKNNFRIVYDQEGGSTIFEFKQKSNDVEIINVSDY